MNLVRCPFCGLLDYWTENLLKPYCSEVCRLLWRHELAWRVQPCRIVVGSHPHLVVQAGPSFDLRESALKGTRARALATERKRRQRAAGRLPDVTPKAQSIAAKRGPFGILGEENVRDAGRP